MAAVGKIHLKSRVLHPLHLTNIHALARRDKFIIMSLTGKTAGFMIWQPGTVLVIFPCAHIAVVAKMAADCTDMHERHFG